MDVQPLDFLVAIDGQTTLGMPMHQASPRPRCHPRPATRRPPPGAMPALSAVRGRQVRSMIVGRRGTSVALALRRMTIDAGTGVRPSAPRPAPRAPAGAARAARR